MSQQQQEQQEQEQQQQQLLTHRPRLLAVKTGSVRSFNFTFATLILQSDKIILELFVLINEQPMVCISNNIKTTLLDPDNFWQKLSRERTGTRKKNIFFITTTGTTVQGEPKRCIYTVNTAKIIFVQI